MSLLVTVVLFRAAFHGLGSGGQVQWPPAPVRLLGALKQGAHSLEAAGNAEAALAHEALELLLTARPPIIYTPEHHDLRIPDTYTDRTWLPSRLSATHGETAKEYLGLDHFGIGSMNRVPKSQGAVALAGRTIEFHIDIDLDADHLKALDSAAGLVPYFGRSNDSAMLTVRGEHAPRLSPEGLIAWHPRASSTGTVLGWQANTIAWMNENHRRRFSDDPAITMLPTLPPDAYTRPLSYSRSIPRAERMHVVELPASCPQPRTPALMQEIAEVLPPRWRALPLTASLHPQSNGRLLGIGLLDAEDVNEPAPHATVNEVLRKRIPDPAPTSGTARTLSPEVWSRSARRWKSTTPLRGFPDIRALSYILGKEAEEHFRTGVAIVGASTEPRLRQHHRWANSAYLDGYAQWWLELEFDEPVDGPISMGATTEHGFGMFLPERENR